MSKATISTENTNKGFSILLTRSENASVYPQVLITYDHTRQESTYSVSFSIDETLNETDYYTIKDRIKEDQVALDFLQLAYLILKQKLRDYKGEIEKLIDEILEM